MYNDIRAQDGEVLAISVDQLDGANWVVQQLGIKFPILYDPDAAAIKEYGVFNLLNDNLAIPSTFILDKAGRVRYRYVPQVYWDITPPSRVVQELRRIQQTPA